MQHSSFEQRPELASETKQVRIAPILPARGQALEFPWSGTAAKRKLVHGFNSRNASSRSFNLIRSKLVSIRRDKGWRMLGIASATPNVGKSFVSANLAAAMSRDPRFQTYLLDLDLRRGTIKDIFDIDTDDGIVSYLEQSDPRSVLAGFMPQGQELIIVPSVPGPVHSAELLASQRASALFSAMRESDERNYFICDLPPVFAN